MSSDDALFDAPASPAARPATKRPEWERITGTRPCDWCMRALAQAGGTGPRSEPARWRHRGQDGDTLLCYRHGRELRTGEATA